MGGLSFARSSLAEQPAVQERSYADLLRAIGRFLDEEGATDAELVEHEHFTSVSWQTGDGFVENRAYNRPALLQLRDKGRRMRSVGNSPGELSELLRTLGQEIDSLAMDVSHVQVRGDAFTITGEVQNRYESHHFTCGELRHLSGQQRANRRLGSPQVSPGHSWWRFWGR
jgi:hypothetical protein